MAWRGSLELSPRRVRPVWRGGESPVPRGGGAAGAVAPHPRLAAAAGVVDGEKATPEPLDLLLQRRLESRALLGVEALLSDRADRRRSEAAHRHEPLRVTGDLLDGAQRLGGNDERRDLALADRLAGLDRLGFEEREDRNPL